MPDLATVVAVNIRAERARRRWRQKDLAERLGWSQATVSEVEAGKRAVNVGDLPLLCQAMGITLSDLFKGADSSEIRAMGLS
jgi:transcriptional regulator with XRE-family HTH domain